MASRATRDHGEIQRWAAEHGACPAVVSRTGGMLRFEFDPARSQNLAEVDWEEFFQVFDEKSLELVFDDVPGSRFHKFVYSETAAAKAEPRTSPEPSRSRGRIEIVPPAAVSGARPGGASGRSGAARLTSGRRRKAPPARKPAPAAKRTASARRGAKTTARGAGARRRGKKAA